MPRLMRIALRLACIASPVCAPERSLPLRVRSDLSLIVGRLPYHTCVVGLNVFADNMLRVLVAYGTAVIDGAW